MAQKVRHSNIDYSYCPEARKVLQSRSKTIALTGEIWIVISAVLCLYGFTQVGRYTEKGLLLIFAGIVSFFLLVLFKHLFDKRTDHLVEEAVLRDKQQKQKAREEFFAATAAFFDSGAVREVYHNDQVSILNYADTAYVVTDYSKSSYGFVGYIFDKETVEFIAGGEYRFYMAFSALNSDQTAKRCVVFDDVSLQKAKALHEKTSVEGPARYIDKKLDEKLLKQNQKRMEEEEKEKGSDS